MLNQDIFQNHTGIYQIFGHSLFYPYEAYELLGEHCQTIDLPTLAAELSKIKGIGGKRLDEIMTVVEKFLDV